MISYPLLTFALLLATSTKSHFSVYISLVKDPSAQVLVIHTSVKNQSDETYTIPQVRRTGFKETSGNGVGNYIVQIQRKVHEAYQDIGPANDWNPIFPDTEYFDFQPQHEIADTIYVNGELYDGQGLPQGKYRIRVWFNPDELSSNLSDSSNWIVFDIGQYSYR